MLNASLLTAPGSPQVVLARYEILVALAATGGHVAWRALADDLTAAATQVPPDFARKYTDRAADCISRAIRTEVRS